MTLVKKAVVLSSILLVLISCNKKDELWEPRIPETDDQPTATEINGFVFRPALASASEENIAQLRVPEGFTVSKFADQLGKPRILAANGNGQVYVSDREAGTVMMIQDADNDGVAEIKTVVATIPQAHGLFIFQNQLYITSVTEVYLAGINGDGTLGQPQAIITNLPDGGQHPNRTLAIGPDGLLYLSVGSTCNACLEPNPMNATMVRANPDGTNLTIFARGLRNTIGFGWHPQTGAFWGMDHGIDWLGDNEQKEELNLIAQNADYGWPFIYGEGKYNPADRPPGDTTYQQYLAKTTLPAVVYDAHAAPMQMAFYTGSQFGAEYTGDAFVAMRGSWNRSTPSGYKVVRVRFEDGQPAEFEDFLTGFLINSDQAHFARPVGVAVHADGSLLVSDDTNGVIYRVAKI